MLKVAKLPFLINDGKWHHICVTWTTRDGVWEAFQDGVMRGTGENLAPYHPIKSQGVLILGQEQVGSLGVIIFVYFILFLERWSGPHLLSPMCYTNSASLRNVSLKNTA